jgi:hypothetical protein
MVEKVEKLKSAKRDGVEGLAVEERPQGLSPPPRTSPFGSESKENFARKCGKKRKFDNRES